MLSHFGLAREISALVGQPLRLPNQPTAGGAPALQEKGIEISSPNDCPFYSARRIENITVGPSPDWLRAKLEAAGLRSINNVVDISNFVMLELGQPTHAFDSDKLKGEIVVRLAREGESFLALDGKTYNLNSQDLVIADQERVDRPWRGDGWRRYRGDGDDEECAVGGCLFPPGKCPADGEEIEPAERCELPLRARSGSGHDSARIATRHGTNQRTSPAGSPEPEIATAGELPAPPPDVSLRYERCAQLIGLTVPKERVDQILDGFGLEKRNGDDAKASWGIPSFRSDLQREADLIEEVVRVFGIERVPVRYRSRFTPESEADRGHDFESELRARLVGRGLAEVRTSKLISRKAAAFEEDAIELRNPLNEDHVALRRSFYPSLLDVLARNVLGGARACRHL